MLPTFSECMQTQYVHLTMSSMPDKCLHFWQDFLLTLIMANNELCTLRWYYNVFWNLETNLPEYTPNSINS